MSSLPPGWSKVKLKSVSKIGDGAHASIQRLDSGVLYLSSKNFGTDRLDLSKVDYISEDDYHKYFKANSKAITKPQEGDVLLGIIGTLGAPYLVKNTDLFGLSSSVAIVRGDKDKLDPLYLYYWFKSPIFQSAINQIKSGVAQSFLSLGMIGNLPCFYPDSKNAQQKIGAILFAYDDLIENNLERIKLLEEMAQITYEEWFVRMKFPDHEEVEIDSGTGLPMEWQEQDLNAYISIKHGYAYKGEFFCEAQTSRVLLTPGNFRIGGGIKLDKVKYYGESAESPEDYILKQHDLLVTMTDLSKMADTLGFPLLVPSSDIRSYLHNQRLGKVLPVGELGFPKYFYYMLFQDEGYRAFVVGSATGATVKHSSPSKILAYKPKLPPLDGELIFKFNDVIRPIFETIDLLMKESELLKEARDILLPRLMTGMIDIEKVELPEALLERINNENDNNK